MQNNLLALDSEGGHWLEVGGMAFEGQQREHQGDTQVCVLKGGGVKKRKETPIFKNFT